MTEIFEVYDAEGRFVVMFLDRDEAYEYANMHETEENSWEVRKNGR